MTPPACFVQIYKRHPSQSERALYLLYFIMYFNNQSCIYSGSVQSSVSLLQVFFSLFLLFVGSDRAQNTQGIQMHMNN